jgi:uncharacterized protein YgbK (DUF1537 family)
MKEQIIALQKRKTDMDDTYTQAIECLKDLKAKKVYKIA